MIHSKRSELFWILPQLHILCTSAVKRYYAKTTIQVSHVSHASEFMEAKKTCRRVVRTSVWSVSYFLNLESFATKMYRQDFRDVDHLKCVLLSPCHTRMHCRGHDSGNAVVVRMAGYIEIRGSVNWMHWHCQWLPRSWVLTVSLHPRMNILSDLLLSSFEWCYFLCNCSNIFDCAEIDSW